MTDSRTAREIHGLANQARESGDFLKALRLHGESMIAFQQERVPGGFAEALSAMFLTLRHLYEQTGDKNYLILAKHVAEASVEVAEGTNKPEDLPIPYFNLAKAQETLGELAEAVEFYQKAVNLIESHPPETHNRTGIKADMKGHLYTAQYKNGDRAALAKAEQSLKDLTESDEKEIARYNYDVWMSGGYMRLAEAVNPDDPQKAQEHLAKARHIIESNAELTLRKNQLDKLIQSLAK